MVQGKTRSSPQQLARLRELDSIERVEKETQKMSDSTNGQGSQTSAIAKTDGDWLDRICDNTTNGLCPVPDNLPEALASVDDEKRQGDEDMLDHVFEHVESFSCRPPMEERQNAEESDLASLSKEEPSQVQQRTATTTSATEKKISTGQKTSGEEPDTLDYVFDKVESFICSSGMEHAQPAEAPYGDSQLAPKRMNSILELEEGKERAPTTDIEASQVSAEVQLVVADGEKHESEIWYKKPKWLFFFSLVVLAIVLLVVFAR
jgi:hypothetical protein